MFRARRRHKPALATEPLCARCRAEAFRFENQRPVEIPGFDVTLVIHKFAFGTSPQPLPASMRP
jgi:hypothetical protein